MEIDDLKYLPGFEHFPEILRPLRDARDYKVLTDEEIDEALMNGQRDTDLARRC